MAGKLNALFSLDGRHALVTGGSSGIGLAIARALGLQGARIVLAARGETALESAAAGLAKEGIQASFVAVDLAEPAGADRLAERVGRSEEHTSELQSRRDLVCR